MFSPPRSVPIREKETTCFEGNNPFSNFYPFLHHHDYFFLFIFSQKPLSGTTTLLGFSLLFNSSAKEWIEKVGGRVALLLYIRFQAVFEKVKFAVMYTQVNVKRDIDFFFG